MEFILRVQKHTDHEIQLHHKLSFSLLDEVDYQSEKNSDNIISVTSDLDGFTTLRSVCRVLNWDEERVQHDVDGCNLRNSSRLIQNDRPSIFMIPRSTDNKKIIDSPEYYISELCKVSDYYETKTVQFTHYSFISEFPTIEIMSLLTLLLNPVFVPRIGRFYWEIDSRFINEMKDVYRYVMERIYRRNKPISKIVHAKNFKFEYNGNTFGKLEIGNFVEDV